MVPFEHVRRGRTSSSCLPNVSQVRREAKLVGGMVPKAVGDDEPFSPISDSRGSGDSPFLVL